MNMIANETFQLAPAVPRLRVSPDPLSPKKVQIELSPPLGETASTRVDSYNFWYFKENESSILRENTTISAKMPKTFSVVHPGSLYHYYAQAVVNGVPSESTTVDFRIPPLPVSELVVDAVTNSTITLSWTNPLMSDSDFDFVDILVPGIVAKQSVPAGTNNITLTGFSGSTLADINVFTRTADPVPSSSAPEIISVYTIPPRIAPESFNATQVPNKSAIAVQWEPLGVFFTKYKIIVEYLLARRPTRKEILLSPKTTEYIIKSDIASVIPGNVYRVSIVALSKTNAGGDDDQEVSSYPTSRMVLILPEPPTYLSVNTKKSYSESLTFQWSDINMGLYDYYLIKWQPDLDCPAKFEQERTFTIEQAEKSRDAQTNFVQYKIDGLHPYCYYDFSVRSALNSTSSLYTGFDENDLVTRGITVTGKTNAELPPLLPQRTDRLNLDMSKVNIGKGTISFEINSLPFSDDFGPLLRFAVWVRKDAGESELKPPPIPKPWINDKNREWIAFWVKLKGESQGQKKQKLVIGDGKESQNKDRYYKNAPLESGEEYRVSIQVENEAGASALYYSQPIKMNDAKKAIAIVIPIVVVLIVAVIVLYYVLRRRQLSTPKENAKNQELGLANGASGPGGGHVNPVFTQDRPKIELNSVDRKSKVIQLVDFKQVYDELRQDSSYKFAGEFFELKEVGKDQTTEASLLSANRGKNRYTNILAYDKTRVKLGATDDDPGSDYINANFIAGNNSKREFIATQGPLPGTKEDFWRMCWEQNTPIIVALCQVVERGRIKCDHYWPYDSDPEWVGSDLQLVMERESTLPNWTERDFILTKGETSRRIKQYHFTVWPDNGVPSSLEPLVKFVRQVRFEMNRFLDRGPTIIHCSAGVGRTGTFVGFDRLLQDYENKSYVDIFGMVYEMRMSRCLMVQTEAQYICLHELVYDLQMGKYNFDRDNGASDNSGEIKADVDTIGAVHAGFSNPALLDTSSSSSGSLTSDEEIILPKPPIIEPDENSHQPSETTQ